MPWLVRVMRWLLFVKRCLLLGRQGGFVFVKCCLLSSMRSSVVGSATAGAERRFCGHQAAQRLERMREGMQEQAQMRLKAEEAKRVLEEAQEKWREKEQAWNLREKELERKVEELTKQLEAERSHHTPPGPEPFLSHTGFVLQPDLWQTMDACQLTRQSIYGVRADTADPHHAR
eukprot:3283995-Rhodomonas_salina.2